MESIPFECETREIMLELEKSFMCKGIWSLMERRALPHPVLSDYEDKSSVEMSSRELDTRETTSLTVYARVDCEIVN